MAFESWIEEMARDELHRLETSHPNHFDYLKTELKLLISQPILEPLFILHDPISLNLSHSQTPTQVSTNQKRKPDTDRGTGSKGKWRKKKRSDKVERAIERAQACLRRIQEVKQSLILPVRG